MNYLVVGDGNFSFSLSLCKQLMATSDGKGVKMVATSFENLDRVELRPQARENLKELQAFQGITVLHNLDATQLKASEDLKRLEMVYDFVIFNFPHPGGKNRIQLNRVLLRDFFVSVSSSEMVAADVEVHVSLCRGQGGTEVDLDHRGYENSWKVTEMAAEGGLVLHRVEPFPHHDYPNYIPTGYRGHTNKGFSLHGAIRHVFKLPSPSRQSLYPPQYQHDISFWCVGSTFNEDAFKSLVDRVCGESVQKLWLLGEYKPCLELERVSYCYRLVYQSSWDALSRTRARELQMFLREAVKKEMGFELR